MPLSHVDVEGFVHFLPRELPLVEKFCPIEKQSVEMTVAEDDLADNLICQWG